MLIAFVFCRIRPQSWPPSLSGNSLRGEDAASADLLTWWLDIPSSQRMSWSRPSSPSAAPYVVPFNFTPPFLLCWLLHSKHYYEWHCNASCFRLVFSNLQLLTPLFPNRMFRPSCATLARKRVTSSWLTEMQLRRRFAHVSWLRLYISLKESLAFKEFTQHKRALPDFFFFSFCRNISQLTFRLSFQQAESWLEASTTASRSCGTELRRWQSAQRRMHLISSCLAKSSGILLTWVWS